MIDKIIYDSKESICRWISICNNEYLIGTESLEKELLDGDFNPISDEARFIDEEILFYVPDGFINAKETVIYSFVEQNLY